MKKIQLTQGQVALVDDADYEELSKHKWYAHWASEIHGFYASRKTCLPDGRRVHERLHRRILGLDPGDNRQVDHLNHDGLDNRRANLRVVTNRGNSNNRTDQSKHGVGVGFRHGPKMKPFHAGARVNGKLHHIGYFSTPKEARDARRKWLAEKGVAV